MVTEMIEKYFECRYRKTEGNDDMKLDFLTLHRKSSGKRLMIRIDTLVGFSEPEEDGAGCTVYFNDTNVEVEEDYDLICSMIKGAAETNIPWHDRRPSGFISFTYKRTEEKK